jgi:hypothetical protein
VSLAADRAGAVAGRGLGRAGRPGSKYPNCRWFVDSSAASLNAFAAMANDVYYTRDEP